MDSVGVVIVNGNNESVKDQNVISRMESRSKSDEQVRMRFKHCLFNCLALCMLSLDLD